jgi:adenine-specific DNA-methyltransferase
MTTPTQGRTPHDELALVRLALDCGAATVGGDLSSAETAVVRSAASLPSPESSMLKRVRNGILAGEDPLGIALYDARSPAARRQAGAIYTPPELVRPMVSWALEKNPRRLVDAGCGSGRYSVAAALRDNKVAIVAVDVDPVATMLTRGALALIRRRHVRVVNSDYTTMVLPSIEGRTAFVGNPPYVRHHRINAKAKKWLVAAAAELRHSRVSTRAGLHAYFFFATALHGKPGDIGCFLTSSEWLDVDYGQSVRHLLLNGLGAKSIHIIDPGVDTFPNVKATGLITCFQLGSSQGAIRIRQVKALRELVTLAGGNKLDRNLFRSDGRWTQLVRPTEDAAPKGFQRVPLRSLFRVRRGVATGANDYFVMKRAEAKDRGLEAWSVPVIAHASEILEANGPVRDDPNRKLLLSPGGTVRRRDFPRLNSYLAQGEHPSGGFPRIKDRYLCHQRDPWWQVEQPSPAPVIATYMARRPPTFALNPDNLALLNIGHYLYPRRSDLDLEAIVWELNRQKDRLAGHGRTYHGGLEKFEPREMGALEIDLPNKLL